MKCRTSKSSITARHRRSPPSDKRVQEKRAIWAHQPLSPRPSTMRCPLTDCMSRRYRLPHRYWASSWHMKRKVPSDKEWRMIIDVHAHYVPASLLDALCAERRMFPSIEILGQRDAVRMGFAGQEPTRPVSPRLSDVRQRKEWLAKQRIDRQIVGGWLDIFGYELPPEEGADWCRFMNEHMRESACDVSEFAPLACVPLQSGKLAAEILEH